MDSSGLAGRNMANMTNNSRSRDFNAAVPVNGDGERASRPGLGWGTSIWNTNSTIGSGLGSTTRDSSRPRENGAYGGASNPIEGKTGSGSLVASSEYDTWNPHRNPWDNGMSPSRKRSLAQPEPLSQYVENGALQYYNLPGQASTARPQKPSLDPTSTNFTTTRRLEPSATSAFPSFGLGQSEAPQRSEASVGSWPDAGSVHSPNDDRRSVAASECFGPSSATPSRSGSLPPSRHGNEPVQFGQNVEALQRYGQAGQRQHSSFSLANGRLVAQGRSGSIQSDTHQLLGRLSLDPEADQGMVSHRPSMSIHGLTSTFNPASNDPTLSRENFTESHTLGRADDAAYATSGAYTPDSYTNGHATDTQTQFHRFRFDSRSAPNGTGVRQSPHHSYSHTPPAFDHLNPYRTDQTLSNNNNVALIHSKLQNYAQSQQRRLFNVNPSQVQQQQQHLQHLLATNQLRNFPNYPYATPNGLPLPTMTPNLTMAPLPGMLPLDAPMAPRDHSNVPPDGTMSTALYNFKQLAKTNRRFELNNIYGHVVEFSGDQHGSRFIQQKLEAANSDEKERVFRELQDNCLQLMQDVFGNYVIQKFFEHGDQTQKRFLANRMQGHIQQLSTGMYGCRVVQKALEYVLVDQQASIVKELERDVLRCVRDQNGNHVIQKVVERVPIEHIQNIIQAFKGQVGALAAHSYGCRVIQRLLEKVPEPQRRFILAELHAEGARLISDQYGNYVTQHVIEHGEHEDRVKVLGLVDAQLLSFSKHKFASNVVEKCLLFGSEEQRRDIMLTITSDEDNLPALIKDGYGNYVIQKMLDTLDCQDYTEFVDILKPVMEVAKKTVSGKQIASVEKKMHRFDRIDSVSIDTPQRNSLGSNTDSAPTPPLTSEAQSPRSDSLPSANASTASEPVSISYTNKGLPVPPGWVGVDNA